MYSSIVFSAKADAANPLRAAAAADIQTVPTYDFRCQCGHAEERVISIKAAPPSGSTVPCPRCRADTLTRILSIPMIADAALRTSIAGYPYVSRRHQGLPECKEDDQGHPIIESPAHEREVMARTGLVRE